MGYALDTAEKRLAERRGDLQPSVVDFIEASGRESRKAARTWAWMQRAVDLLMVVIIAGLVAYINQAFLQEEYYRQVTMGLRVLTAAEEKEKAAKPGPETTFKECSNGCPTMVVVPAGTFKMGSSRGGGADNERPQHDVTIPRAFAVGRTEVTYAEWDVCGGSWSVDPESLRSASRSGLTLRSGQRFGLPGRSDAYALAGDRARAGARL